MKPGDRIELLKKLAGKLSERDWGEADLVLRQFGLPWSDRWEASPLYDYVLHHLERGEDVALRELFEYLFPEEAATDAPSVNTEGPWTPGLFRLFLSHISSDKRFVAELKGSLTLSAIDGFVAHEDIEPTKEWVKEIETALETCHALAAILSSEFHGSYWTDQEVGYCIKRRVLIVPVMRGFVPYGFMGRSQGLDAHKKAPPEIASDLFSILIDHPLSSGQMASAIVSYFGGSPSYAETRRRLALVGRIKAWTPELLQRLEGSIERNREIKDGVSGGQTVPDRIRAIVEQHSKK